MILQLGILFVFLAIGEGVVYLTGIPVPSSIIGMLLLTLALKLGVVKIHQVERSADLLVKNMGFFFVPAGVAVMLHLHLIKEQWLPIVAAATLSTAIVLAVTGHVHRAIRKLMTRVRHGEIS